ncbi:hypothetical protein SOVF_200360 isoform B [Spinacia oleracea]|nr:hypothetical protein SOVF_200360 isoform B [Spinacia oleracea]
MVYEVSAKRINPWARELDYNPDYYTPDIMYYEKNLLHKRPKFSQMKGNTFLDIHTRRAVLVASPFVVSLVSYTGEKEMNQGSGFIVATDDTNTGIVFTSANLIRRFTENNVAENNVPENDFVENELADLKVQVILADGRSYEGVVCAHDFHYNIAAIRFTSEYFVSCAPLKLVDDSMDVKPSFQIRRNSSSVKLSPGDVTVVMGRYFTHPYEVMAAPGAFCLDCCGYDCKELFNTTCNITRCGDGGPLVNLAGDVIGIAFFDDFLTPFLPINIAYKLQMVGALQERWRVVFFSSIGNFVDLLWELRQLFYVADLDVTEKIIQKFPSISKGVIVEKVIPGSFAYSAGLRPNDVIIQCGGKEVPSFLEFLEIILDNVGKFVELVVARVGCVTLLYPKMMIGELTSDKLNRWPRREKW